MSAYQGKDSVKIELIVIGIPPCTVTQDIEVRVDRWSRVLPNPLGVFPRPQYLETREYKAREFMLYTPHAEALHVIERACPMREVELECCTPTTVEDVCWKGTFHLLSINILHLQVPGREIVSVQ